MKRSKIRWIAGLGVGTLGSLMVLAQTPAVQPIAQVRGNEGAGSTIFGNSCEGCHGKLDSAPPPALPDGWQRTGRNAICPCGSGRKFKHCHGALV